MRLGLGLGYQRRGGASAPPAAATLSGLAYAADLISVTTDTASGTIYYLLHNSVTPLSGAAIKSAVVGLTAVGGGTLDPLETDNQPVDWTAVTPGTYWINMVQDTGVFSNVVSLEVTIVAASFDPASLPGALIVMDASDISTLFQDAAGSTPVTASGQSVQRVNNRGTAGNYWTNAGGGVRPVYTEASGRKFIRFDGTDDNLLLDQGAGAAFNLSGGFFLYLVAFDDGTGTTFSASFMATTAPGAVSNNSQSGLQIWAREAGTDPIAIKLTAGLGDITTQIRDTRTTDLPWSYFEFETVPTAASPCFWGRLEKASDGGVPFLVGSGDTSGSPTVPDNMTGGKLISLGAGLAGAGGTLAGYHKCDIAALVLVTGTLSTTDRDNIRAWCRTRAGF